MRRLIALRLLLHDRSTTAGAILGVVAIVFLVGQQLSVLFGLFTYMTVLLDHSGADIWITSKNTDNINAIGSLPVRYVNRIIGLPEIAWAEPLISGGGSVKRLDGKYQPVQVVGLARPRLPSGPWRFNQGSLEVLLDYHGLTLDRLDLNNFGDPKLKDVLEVSDKKIRISGITQRIRGFQGTLVFTNLQKAREITKLSPGRCSTILVKVKQGTSVDSVLEKIRIILPQAEATATSVLAQNTRRYYMVSTGIGSSFGFSTLIGAVVGIVIITLTMYTNVLNRQKDFAVLRALGARKRDILVVVLFQALYISLVGILIGFLFLALFLSAVQDSRLPTYMFLWVPPLHAVITILLSVAGSILAMSKATAIEPASAFR
jgi:putative ABC transport system permease protein